MLKTKISKHHFTYIDQRMKSGTQIYVCTYSSSGFNIHGGTAAHRAIQQYMRIYRLEGGEGG